MERDDFLWAVSQVHATLVEGGYIADRRERIATAALQGSLSAPGTTSGRDAYDYVSDADVAALPIGAP